ncbi:hypothetical protein D3C72_798880 [compost metagenome]
MRVIDAKDLHALLDPTHHDVTQLHPQARNRLGGIEVDVDNVLVFLRRVLRVFDRAVGPPVEPAGVLLEPWVVLGALDGEVEGDFQAVGRSGRHQSPEVFASPQLLVNRLVAALLATDRIGTARIIGACRQRVVRALAVTAPDRVDRREIQHIEAHVVDHRQPRMHVVESTVALRAVGDRTRKQFIPTGELRQLAFHIHRVLRAQAEVSTMIDAGHEIGATLVQKQCDLLGFEQSCQFMVQCRQLLTELPLTALGGLLHLDPPFLQFEADGHRCHMLLFQFVAKTGELIDPGFDTVKITALTVHPELPLPTVVAQILHDSALPDILVLGPPAHANRQLVMPVGKDLGGDHHILPHHRLDRELPAVKGRHDVFYDNARQQQRLRQRHVRVVAQLSRFFSRHRASLLTPHGRACVWSLPQRAIRPGTYSLRFRAMAAGKSSSAICGIKSFAQQSTYLSTTHAMCHWRLEP